jgi:hypothetical protein
MRGIGLAGALLSCAVTVVAWAGPAHAKETQAFAFGQWTGFFYTDNETGAFTDCTVWAFNRDKVQVGISVKKDWSLEFWLNSDSWDLPKDQSYPVSYWVDRNPQYRGRVVTNGDKFAYVQVDEDNAVFQELKSGNALTFRTSAEDYVFDLSGSRAALERLLDCVDQHTKAAASNPFGAGSEGAQQDNSQQPSGNEQGNGPGDTTMKTLTVSVDEVHQFLVDVTGAKPSMITVTAKTDKQGAPFYKFSTPLGDGEFWQEKLSGDELEEIADDYAMGYKNDCKGTFEDTPMKPVQGQHGHLVAGTAACSSSPYQNDGPEFLSYSMLESDGVISIYITYVGGNAAKAKTDGLGKLIARRSEDLAQ